MEELQKPIETLEELQNICVLGLPLYVVTYEARKPGHLYSPWMLRDASVIQGKDGPELGSPAIVHRHVKIWGIKDAPEYGDIPFARGISHLFSTEEDASAWYSHLKEQLQQKKTLRI